MKKRGAWVNRRMKARFTGNLAEYEVGRKTECRVKGCVSFMLKGEIHYAAQVEGYSPVMSPGICERPTPFGDASPYVLICRECGNKKKKNPNYWLRRK